MQSIDSLERYLDQSTETVLIADSCHCGLNAADAIFKKHRDKNIIFLADYKYNPFGKKDSDTIRRIVESWIDHFKRFNLSNLVIACNTASIAFSQHSKKDKYDHISIISMLDALKSYADTTISIKGKKICILGTKLTIESGVYQGILQEYQPVSLYMQEATFCERLVSQLAFHDMDLLDKAMDELRSAISFNPDIIMLSCTCFSRLNSVLRNIYSGQIVDLNHYLMSEVGENKEEKLENPIILITSCQDKLSILNKSFDDIYPYKRASLYYDWHRDINC